MLTEEIWKDVEGYEKLYQVSNLGRVRSLGRDIIRNTRWGTSKPYHIAGKVLKILRAQADYRYVHLFDEQGTPTNKKAQCLSDLTDALPHYRKQLDRIDGRLTDYIADAISDQDAHANIYELLGIRKVLRLMDGAPLVLNTNYTNFPNFS